MSALKHLDRQFSTEYPKDGRRYQPLHRLNVSPMSSIYNEKKRRSRIEPLIVVYLILEHLIIQCFVSDWDSWLRSHNYKVCMDNCKTLHIKIINIDVIWSKRDQGHRLLRQGLVMCLGKNVEISFIMGRGAILGMWNLLTPSVVEPWIKNFYKINKKLWYNLNFSGKPTLEMVSFMVTFVYKG